jgi:3-oxoacyl-[acyl-carrier-protein] synthase-3
VKDVYLKGPVSFLPEQIVDNQKIVELCGHPMVTADWIEKRTGISKRHWVNENQACSDIARASAEKLINEKNLKTEKLELLVLSTISPDYLCPPTSSIVHHQLQLPMSCGVFDLGAACGGFNSLVHTAAQFIHGGKNRILCLSAEVRSKFLNYQDIATTALFADAAVACQLNSSPDNADFKLLAGELYCDSDHYDLISIEMGGSRHPFQPEAERELACLKMKNSAQLFLKAVDGMTRLAQQFIQSQKIDTIDWLIPHQANTFILEEVAKKLAFDSDRMINIIKETGNTSGASAGVALSLSRNRFQSGEKILMTSIGAGGIGAALYLEVV